MWWWGIDAIIMSQYYTHCILTLCVYEGEGGSFGYYVTAVYPLYFSFCDCLAAGGWQWGVNYYCIIVSLLWQLKTNTAAVLWPLCTE